MGGGSCRSRVQHSDGEIGHGLGLSMDKRPANKSIVGSLGGVVTLCSRKLWQFMEIRLLQTYRLSYSSSC